jgi:hypothetical protein
MQRTRTIIAIAWILFWILMVSTSVQEYLRDHDHGIWKPMLWETSSALVGTLLLLAQRRFTQVRCADCERAMRWFLRQLAWLPVYWVMFVPAAFGIRHAVYALMGETYPHEAGQGLSVRRRQDDGVLQHLRRHYLWRAVLPRHAGRAVRVERANASLREAQLLRLSQQMQPHFLFNALNTISSLMYSDVAAGRRHAGAAVRCTARHAGCGRAPSGAAGDRTAHPARLCGPDGRAVCGPRQHQLADRRRCAGLEVPVMSMQPLLENVFKHTVEKRRQPTAITSPAPGDMLRCAAGR